MKHVNLTDGNVRVLASEGFDGVYKKYTVVRGDTLGKIAKEYGTTVECLAKVNEIANVNLIDVDQVLLVPAEVKAEEKKAYVPGKVTAAGYGLYKISESDHDGIYHRYVVVKGDTLGKLARDYGTTVECLAKVNNIENVDLIEIDQILYIPATAEEVEKVNKGPAAKVNFKSIK